VPNRLRGSAELSVPLRLRILMSVLAGLEHAHTLTDLDGRSLEVVHRDVSPQNVFVTYDGQVKLVDFGVAKTLAASHHTRPGALKGKLAYMAPEQLQPVAIDRRADLFAVGIMLWEMLAGKRMWQGMNEVQIVSQLAAGLPFPPLPADAGLPPGLDAICARALEPEPDRRYQTAAEMEMDLDRVSVGAADSHARNLGRVVSLAFSPERSERRALIDEGARPGGDEPPPAPPARDLGRGSGRPIEVTVSDLGPEPGPAAQPVMAAALAPLHGRRIWARRALAVAGLLGIGAALVQADGGWRRLVERRAAADPSPAAMPLAPAPVPPPAPVSAPREPGAVAVADGVAARDPLPHPHRHHRRPPPDGDAPLPPTPEIAGTSLDDPPPPAARRAPAPIGP
jgi:serine/threonine-protein kinase